jgi:uncharacterized Zn-finger protein
METNHSNPNLQYIQLKKKKKPFLCKYCKREYKTEPNLKKHMILCEVLHQSINTNTNTSISTNTIFEPSQTQLYQIIQELTVKQKKMEEKIDQLQKWVDIKKKKFSVLEWLSKNVHPDYPFKNLIDIFTIGETDIDFLYKPDNSVVDLIQTIFERGIDNQPKLPVYSFSQKPNILYYYDLSNNQSSLWKELPREKLTQFLNQIHSKILNQLMEWKKKHHEFIHSNDKNEILYCKMMGKFMGVDFKHPTILNKIYTYIYNKLKIDKIDFVEYEMDF